MNSRSELRFSLNDRFKDEDVGLKRVPLSLLGDFAGVEEFWITVEKYIHGRVLDWGGETKPNVLLKLDNGTVLTIAATQSILQQEKQNLLYRPTLLHISAQENLLTGALRNPILRAFQTQPPAYDEAEFQEMVKRGTEAWSDTPNATQWLEDLRGVTARAAAWHSAFIALDLSTSAKRSNTMHFA